MAPARFCPTLSKSMLLFCTADACKSPREKVYGDFSVPVRLDSVLFWLFKKKLLKLWLQIVQITFCTFKNIKKTYTFYLSRTIFCCSPTSHYTRFCTRRLSVSNHCNTLNVSYFISWVHCEYSVHHPAQFLWSGHVLGMASVGSLPNVAFGTGLCGLLWHGLNTELSLCQPLDIPFIFTIDQSFLVTPLPHLSIFVFVPQLSFFVSFFMGLIYHLSTLYR